MNLNQLYLSVLIVTITSGCAGITKTYIAEDVFINTANRSYITENEEIDLSQLDYTKYQTKKEKEPLIAEMIALSDRKCTWHKATIMANANVWNIGAGSATTLFAGAASVVTNAQTASVLAAAASATSGIRALANQEIYGDALTATILSAIDLKREKQRIGIIQKLEQTIPDYSIASAIRDIQEYHSSCSLMQGVVEITEALANRKKTRTEVERDIKSLNSALASPAGTFTQEQTDSLQSRLARSHLDLIDAAE